MGFLDKAKDLAQQAKDKAGPHASKGLDAAKSGLDKATGGKYHDQIENAGNKVEGALKRDQDQQGGQQGGADGDPKPGQGPKEN